MHRAKAAVVALVCAVVCAGMAGSASASRYKLVYAFKGSDGAVPTANLLAAEGTLYGTTLNGGHYSKSEKCQAGCGVVFSLDPKSGTEEALHAFGSRHDGAGPGA